MVTKPSTVVMNDFVAQWAAVSKDALAAVERVGQSGWLVLGREVDAFERALAERCGARHCVGVANGLDALEIALRCLGVGRGDKVVTTPLSAFATTLAVLRVGAVPVFVDVDDSGLMELGGAQRALERHRDVKAILPVHLFGHALDVTALEALGKAHSVPVIEDAAQAILARSNGRPVGAASRAWATSFYPTKNLGAFGDAGALFTDDDAVAQRARSLRDYGQTAKYVHSELGLNSRLDELQAAMMRSALLPRLDAFTKRRAEIARRYVEGLAHRALVVPPTPKGSQSVFHLFPVLVGGGRRAEFMAHLKERGVASGIHYPLLISDQAALTAGTFHVEGELSQAKRFARDEVSLPLHPFLSDDEVARVVDACNEFPS